MKISVYTIINNPLPQLYKVNKFSVTKEELESYGNIVNMLNKNLKVDKLSSENIYALSLTYGMIPRGIIHVSSGKCDSCDVNIRDLAIGLLLTGAEQFICFHNHPGGNREISVSDLKLTEQYRTLGKIIGIEFLKHIMITQDYFDYCEEDDDELPFS